MPKYESKIRPGSFWACLRLPHCKYNFFWEVWTSLLSKMASKTLLPGVYTPLSLFSPWVGPVPRAAVSLHRPGATFAAWDDVPSESLREHLSISALDLSSCSYSEYRIPDLAQRSSHTYNQMNAFMSHYTQCHRSLSGNPASSREEHQRFHFLSIVKFTYMVYLYYNCEKGRLFH